ncbi:hypothetical protein [Rhodoligotrophos defluvii]|uniref:hypothetical protein n=1 Tax=Rhodoligotrophos defluvii TaxID=2561934 RepID=UPI0010C9EBCB|nr:hypothetical protein [Rhodoligotrophos defluvii]
MTLTTTEIADGSSKTSVHLSAFALGESNLPETVQAVIQKMRAYFPECETSECKQTQVYIAFSPQRVSESHDGPIEEIPADIAGYCWINAEEYWSSATPMQVEAQYGVG